MNTITNAGSGNIINTGSSCVVENNKEIHFAPSNSSTIREVTYNKADQFMRVTFKQGGNYIYGCVPESRMRDLIAAESVGKFFAQHIRDVFPAMKIS